MSAIALIPARFASTRFPGKPLALIRGRPMIELVYKRAIAIEGVAEAIVATDSPQIREAVEGFGGRVVMTKETHKSGSDRLAEAADILSLPDSALVLNVQGDQPAFSVGAAGKLVREMTLNPAIEMGTAAATIADPSEELDPNHVKVVLDENGFALYFSRSPIPFDRGGLSRPRLKHLGLYAYRAGFLRRFVKWPQSDLEIIESLEQLRVLSKGGKIWVMAASEATPEVDTPADVAKVEAALEREGGFIK